MSQIWLGTNYGSVIVLNSISTINSSNVVANEAQAAETDVNVLDTENLKSTVINSTGTHLQLKGQILDIAFLDMNGILLTLVNSNNNLDSSTKSMSKLADDDLDLDIDFNLNAQMLSNSIADNFFFGASSNAAATTNNEQLSHEITSASSSSPNTTPTANSFVNPFGNNSQQQPNEDLKENKFFNKISKSRICCLTNLI